MRGSGGEERAGRMEIKGSTRWSGLYRWRVSEHELNVTSLTAPLRLFEALLLGLQAASNDGTDEH